jgi:hypothetical protein
MIIHLRDNILRELKRLKLIYLDKIESGRLSPDEYKFIAGKNLGIKEAENVFKESFSKLFSAETMGEKEL